MPIYNLLMLIGFGFGTALTLILLGLSIKKSPKRFDDYAFGVLLISCALWHGGHFISQLSVLLFRSAAETASNILILFAYAGLAAMPSAVIQVPFTHLIRHHNPALIRLPLQQRLMMALFYSPMVGFLILTIWKMAQSESILIGAADGLRTSFLIWTLLAISAAASLTEKLISSLKSDSDRLFYRDMTYSLAAIGFGIIVIYILPIYRVAYIGQYFNLLILLAPAFPMGILAYYVYRYNFYRLVIKPSLIYSIIYGSLMAIYLLVIRRLGTYLSQFPEVNSSFIEGLLLVGLVFLFQPFRNYFQARLDRLFFKDRLYYQQALHELSNSISRIVDLERLLEIISQTLISVLQVKSCSLILFDGEPESGVVYKFFGNQRFTNIAILVRALKDTHHLRIQRQMANKLVRAALEENNLDLAVPIHFQNRMAGLIGLSEKKTGDTYSENEIDVLQTFANQIGLAIANARLVQDRLDLEARVYQAEKMNSLGQLATSIAHEIKNPLSSIKVIIQVLEENTQGQEKGDLRLILSEINRLNSVLEKLLSFARPATSQTEALDLATLVADVIALLKHQAIKSNVDLSLAPAAESFPMTANRQSVREIVFNLIFNAIQAMPRGGRVSVQLSKSPALPGDSKIVAAKQKSAWISLCVRDNGPGIPAEHLKQIFEPFYTTRNVGSGLGLAIVKRNVNECGGEIKVQSELGKGSEFCVFFPSAAL